MQAFIDDAAAVYLNGEEVWRTNLPDGPIRYDTLASSAVGDPEDSEVIQISSESLRRGNNVIAVEVHQSAINDGDMAFALDLVATEHPIDPNIQLAALAINEIGREGDELLVEVINRGSSTIDTTGFHLAWSNNADSIGLPAVDLRAGQFLVVRADASTVGDGSAFLIDAAQNAVTDSVSITGRTQARSPDGQGAWFNVQASTFGQPNLVTLEDSVVISEIQYHPIPTYDVPETRREFELVPFLEQWRYRDDGTDLGTDWREPDFDDNAWSTGDAILYAGAVDVDFRNSPQGSVSAEPILVANSGFEGGALPPLPGYGQIAGWSGGDQTGVNDRTGPFLSGLRIPEGKRVAFLHGQQQISQTLSGFEPARPTRFSILKMNEVILPMLPHRLSL